MTGAHDLRSPGLRRDAGWAARDGSANDRSEPLMIVTHNTIVTPSGGRLCDRRPQPIVTPGEGRLCDRRPQPIVTPGEGRLCDRRPGVSPRHVHVALVRRPMTGTHDLRSPGLRRDVLWAARGGSANQRSAVTHDRHATPIVTPGGRRLCDRRPGVSPRHARVALVRRQMAISTWSPKAEDPAQV